MPFFTLTHLSKVGLKTLLKVFLYYFYFRHLNGHNIPKVRPIISGKFYGYLQRGPGSRASQKQHVPVIPSRAAHLLQKAAGWKTVFTEFQLSTPRV